MSYMDINPVKQKTLFKFYIFLLFLYILWLCNGKVILFSPLGLMFIFPENKLVRFKKWSKIKDVAVVKGKRACCCCCEITSVVSDSVRPHRQQPTRLLHPWDSRGKNTRVGCHFLLQCIKVKSESEVAQSCPTLRDPIDCSWLFRPWDFPGKSTGVGAIAFSKALLQTSINSLAIILERKKLKI